MRYEVRSAPRGEQSVHLGLAGAEGTYVTLQLRSLLAARAIIFGYSTKSGEGLQTIQQPHHNLTAAVSAMNGSLSPMFHFPSFSVKSPASHLFKGEDFVALTGQVCTPSCYGIPLRVNHGWHPPP